MNRNPFSEIRGIAKRYSTSGTACAKVRKGLRAVSPVIAALLLVVIVVSASLSAYFWYRNMQQEVTTKMEGKVEEDITKLYAGLRIVYAYTNEFKLRNTGSVALYSINVYEVDGGTRLIMTINGTLQPNTEQSYIPASALTENRTLYVVAKYTEDKYVIRRALVQTIGARVGVADIAGTGSVTAQNVSAPSEAISSSVVTVV